MGAWAAVAVLACTGWTFLNPIMSWAYIAVAAAIDVWLFYRVRVAGAGPAAVGEAPYFFSQEQAELIGRYRFYFTYPEAARQASAALSAVGLSALVLAPWLTYKHVFVQAALIGLNLLAVAAFTKQTSPLLALRVRANKGDRAALHMLEVHDPLWAKINAANEKSP